MVPLFFYFGLGLRGFAWGLITLRDGLSGFARGLITFGLA